MRPARGPPPRGGGAAGRAVGAGAPPPRAPHAEPVPADQLLDALAEPLSAIHRIPGSHAGRLAGARRHNTWRDYLHDRLDAYTATAPDLARAALGLRHELDTITVNIEPRLLHHDLQVGHLVCVSGGLLIDWELAAFGDPLSDLARLAVRLGLPDPVELLSLAQQQDSAAARRMKLYWRIHRLADAAFNTDPEMRSRAWDLIRPRRVL
ncbi:phosphotransferase family protein [Streptomyces sp. NPDC058622]|uniref:phosphotransferase family protein n=1 Tax=Streptomyces sp. NPDC058622 TaxID=3346562 RepID=UPI00365B769B